MAIRNTKEYLQKIYYKVRKGSLQFEPQDRIPVYINTPETAQPKYFIGSVSLDEYSGKLCYSLFTADGKFVPCVASSGIREMETLSPKEIGAVEKMTETYFNRSLMRIQNLRAIASCLNHQIEEFQKGVSIQDSLEFVDNKPEIIIPDGQKFENVKVDSLFSVPPGQANYNEIYVSGKDRGGHTFNICLDYLTDTGLSNVRACLPQPKLTQKVSVDRTEKVSQPKAKKNGVSL